MPMEPAVLPDLPESDRVQALEHVLEFPRYVRRAHVIRLRCKTARENLVSVHLRSVDRRPIRRPGTWSAETVISGRSAYLAEDLRVVSSWPAVHLAAIASKRQERLVEPHNCALAGVGPNGRQLGFQVGGDVHDMIDPLQWRPDLEHKYRGLLLLADRCRERAPENSSSCAVVGVKVAIVGNVDQLRMPRVQPGSQPLDDWATGPKRAIRLTPEFDAGETQDRGSGAGFPLAYTGGLVQRTPTTASLARGEEDNLHTVAFGDVFAQCATTSERFVIRVRAEDEYARHGQLRLLPQGDLRQRRPT